MLNRALAIVGLVIAAFGALFLLQGLGIVRWPASSFMIGRQQWVDNGAAVVVIGLCCVLVARRLGRRQRQREASAVADRAGD